tara:strand:- start:290 stop:622 length:333 start_codon:yes stop_codon:yes gene_type:complete
LSKYKNRQHPLVCPCEYGLENKTSWASLQKSWCSVCSRNKKGSIEEMDQIAKKRKGKCISRKYVNRSTKLELECKKTSLACLPSNIRNKGSCCPICFNEIRENSKWKQKK